MDLMNAIKNTIFNTVLSAYTNTSDDPSSSPYQNEEVTVGQIWPSQIIDEAEYGNAWSPTNPNGIMAATENLSNLVDHIPNINNWYSKSGRKVEKMYEFMITGAEAYLSDTDKKKVLLNSKKKDNIPTDTNISIQEVVSELIDRKEIDVKLPNNLKIKTFFLSPEALHKKELEITHSNATAALIAHRIAYGKTKTTNTAMKKKGQGKISSKFHKIKQQTWNELNKINTSSSPKEQKSKTANSLNTLFHEANLLFSRSTLASVRNPGISYHPSYTSPENWVDSNAKNTWPLLTIPVENTEPQINLSITFSRIDITRPWLVGSLFNLGNWKTSQGAGSLSTGTLKNNTGSFSLLPQSMIVARDIIAKTGTDTVYRSSGLQVLAYISKLTPYAPPF